jgi:hypothetical protein
VVQTAVPRTRKTHITECNDGSNTQVKRYQPENKWKAYPTKPPLPSHWYWVANVSCATVGFISFLAVRKSPNRQKKPILLLSNQQLLILNDIIGFLQMRLPVVILGRILRSPSVQH